MSHNVFAEAMSNNGEWQDEEGRTKEERIRADLRKIRDKVAKKGGRIKSWHTDDYQASNGMWYNVFETGYKPQASNEDSEKEADKIVKALAQEGMTVGTEDGPLFGRKVPLNRGSKGKGGSGAELYGRMDVRALSRDKLLTETSFADLSTSQALPADAADLAATSGGGLSGACSSGDAAESNGIGKGYQPQRGPGQSASSSGQAC